MAEKKVKRQKFSEPRTCPYCDSEIAEAAFPYCEACHLKVQRCSECGKVVAKGDEKCPRCGTAIEKEAKGN